MMNTPAAIASAPRAVCIAPRETRRVVESDAGWLALIARVPAVVIVAAITAAQILAGATKPDNVTCGAFQAPRIHKAKKAAPTPM